MACTGIHADDRAFGFEGGMNLRAAQRQFQIATAVLAAFAVACALILVA